MKLRWSNGHSRSIEFDAGRQGDFEATLENAMLAYREPVCQDNDRIFFRLTRGGHVALQRGNRSWASQHSWPDLEAARVDIEAGRVAMPSDLTVQYHVFEHDEVMRLCQEHERAIEARVKHLESLGYVLSGWISSTTNAADVIQLHVEASPGMWCDPLFNPPDDADPIRVPCDFLNGQPTESGEGEIRLCRQTHVIQSQTALTGGSRSKGDRRLVHPAGYHEAPEPTLCGLYWNDWVLKVGPGHWHADALWYACMAAIRYNNQIIGFVADIVDCINDDDEGGCS